MTADTRSAIALDRRTLTTTALAGAAQKAPTLQALHFQDNIRIRGCRQSDHDAICRLCFDTGFLGRSADSLFHDRELFAELFTRPYLDYEPEWGIVAEAEGRVVGYLLGSVCRYFDWLQLWSGLQTTSKLIFRLATGRYRGHPRSRKFIRWLFTSGLREQPGHPGGAAHLHFEIEKRYRGRGLCLKMWSIYEGRLREAGVKQCYGAFFSYPRRRPELVYARYGFTVYDRRRTTLFEPEISEPVEVVCVSRML